MPDPVLQTRIEALLADYVHCIDDDRLEDWPAFFTAAGRYHVVTRENHERKLPVALIYCDGRGMLRDRISALRNANIFEPHVYCHTVSAVRVLAAGADGFRARSNFSVVRTMADGEIMPFANGRMFDHIVEEAGTLLFAERTVVLDSRRIDTLLVIPF